MTRKKNVSLVIVRLEKAAVIAGLLESLLWLAG
jgi:hypothetical protein